LRTRASLPDTDLLPYKENYLFEKKRSITGHRFTSLQGDLWFEKKRYTKIITCMRRSIRYLIQIYFLSRRITFMRSSTKFLDTDLFPYQDNYLYEKKHLIT
jgi:hypothetical protein